MARYDVKQSALQLKGNPLLPDLLEQLKQDVLQQFPTAAEHELVGLQIEYNLAEKLGTMVNNAIHREAD